jgi:serine protease SohB
VLTLVKPEDQVVLRLESPGGVVHGYGLAASQLQRLRDKQVPLTVAVDKVAASGGYDGLRGGQNCCSAVFYYWIDWRCGADPQLQPLPESKEIDIELHTAGQFKRTLTLLGENTEEGGRNSARASMKRMTCSKALCIRCARNWI